jgi:hypothetical protein
MVHQYTYYVSGHYPSSCFYLKHPVYISKHNVSETGFSLRLQVKSTQLGPIDRASPYLRTPVQAPRKGIQAKHSINHLRELRQNIKILKTLYMCEVLHQSTTEIITGEMKFTVWFQHKKNKFSHSMYTGRSCSFFTSPVMTGFQMREMSKLGSLIGWSSREMWADF